MPSKKKSSYGGKSSLPVLPPPPPTKVGNKTLGNILVVLDPLTYKFERMQKVILVQKLF